MVYSRCWVLSSLIYSLLRPGPQLSGPAAPKDRYRHSSNMAPADDNFDVLLIWWIENESHCQKHIRKITPSLGDGAVWWNFHARFKKFDYLRERMYHKLVYRSAGRRDLMSYWSVHKRTSMGLFPWLPDLDTGKVTGSGPDISTLGTVESVSSY